MRLVNEKERCIENGSFFFFFCQEPKKVELQILRLCGWRTDGRGRVLVWGKRGAPCAPEGITPYSHAGLSQVLSVCISTSQLSHKLSLHTLYWWRNRVGEFLWLTQVQPVAFLNCLSTEVPDTALCQAELPQSQVVWVRAGKEGWGLWVWQAESRPHCRALSPYV